MKKTWIRKDDKGVSPVIATILMVAITVVLAAVLYLMVSNFTQTDAGGDAPTITLGSVGISGGNATIEIAGASAAKDLDQFKIIVLETTGAGVDSTIEMDPVSAGTSSNITVIDVNGDGKLGSGDKMKIRSGEGGEYELILYWRSSDGKITSTSWDM